VATPPGADPIAALAALPDAAFARADATGRVGACTPAFRRLFALADEAPADLAALFGPAGAGAIDTAARDGHLAPTELALPDGRVLRVRAGPLDDGHRLWQAEDRGAEQRTADDAAKLGELIGLARRFGRMGVWERDLRTGRGRWDREIFEFFGLPPGSDSPTRDAASARVHPSDHANDDFDSISRLGGSHARRFRTVHPDGSLHWIQSQWVVLEDLAGTPVRALGLMMDDTEAVLLARSLSDASAQLKLAVELGDISVWRHDLRSGLTFYDERAFRILGLPPQAEGLTAEQIRSAIHPDDLDRMRETTRRTLDTHGPVDVEARFLHADGRWRHVLMRRVAQRNAQGTPVAIVGVALDITRQVEQRVAAEALARQLGLAASATGVGIWRRALDNDDRQWNEGMFRIVGRQPEQGVPSVEEWKRDILHPEDRPGLEHALEDLRETGGAQVEHVFRIVRPDGEVRWVVNRARAELVGGQPLVYGVTMDVTAQRRTELELRAADERVALAARGAGIGTWAEDFASGATTWDEQMWRLRGLPPQPHAMDEAARKALVHPDDLAALDAAYARALPGGEPIEGEFRVRLPDGRWRWLATRSSVVRDTAGRPLRRIGVNWDITAAREAGEAQVRRDAAERASRAKSELLARISHELRTPLNAVLGFTQLLELEAGRPLTGDRLAQLGRIREAGAHLLALVDDVLDLTRIESGREPLQMAPVELACVTADALAAVAATAARHGVRAEAGRIEGRAVADATRLRQVLVNLIDHAVRASGTGGRVTVAGGPGRLVVTHGGAPVGESTLAGLFEPFGGDEAFGPGTALALARALAEQMSGTLAVERGPAGGTQLVLGLPRAPDAAAAAEMPAAPPPPGARVLYIEDNAVNVTLVEAVIAGVPGLELATAVDGVQGVALARQLRPDLVLVDMHLPDIDGLEVLRRLRADPATAALPCIALSANAMPEDMARARQAGFADYWTKPIDVLRFRENLAQRFGLRS
jgi:PAS domain S-box-containing protein